MAIRIPFLPFFRILLIGIVPIAVAACAGVRPTVRPLGTATFVAPVFPGDTMSVIATRYGIGVNELMALNSVKDPNRKVVRGQVRVPAYARPREEPVQQVASPAEPPVMAVPVVPTQSRPAPIESRALAPLPPPSTPRARTGGAAPAAPRALPGILSPSATAVPPSTSAESSWYDFLIPETPPAAAVTETGRHFLWPIEGRILSAFGENPNGGRNDGINISASRGASVRAADAGEVSYVGNELKGYGNLILIRHDNGFISAYAHAETVHVKRGERVARGQVIGQAGNTGDVTQPQVHFELRRGTTPVDPMHYLVAPTRASVERLAEGTR